MVIGYATLPVTWGVYRWAQRVLPELPASAWEPLSLYALLPREILGNAPLARSLAVLTMVMLGLATVGLFTRWALGAGAILALYVLGLPQNLGKIDHYHHLIWFMVLLALAPCDRFLSIDSLIRAVRDADRGRVDQGLPPGSALAALRWVWALIGLLYLIPGLAKLGQAVTSDWVSAENMRNIVWSFWLQRWLYGTGFRAPGWVADLPPWVFTAAGVAVIAFEVGFIALVFIRPLRVWLALAGLTFHRVNGFVIGIFFGFLTPAYVALVDWAAFGRAATRRLAGARLEVVYDDRCRWCRRLVAVARVLDPFDAIAPVASGDLGSRSGPAVETRSGELQVTTGGRTARGYDACVAIATRLPLLWPAALVMRLPFVTGWARQLHRHEADRPAEPAAVGNLDTDARETPRRLIRAAGIALFVGQAAVSLSYLLATDAQARPLVRALQVGWPFDRYPLFVRERREIREVWLPRAVLAGGREVAFVPLSFTQALGTRTPRVTSAILRTTDPEAQRAASLEVLRLLWPRQPRAMRADAVEVRVYAVTFVPGVPPLSVQSERTLHSFAADELRTPVRRAGSTPRTP